MFDHNAGTKSTVSYRSDTLITGMHVRESPSRCQTC
nr:MAG TPA: hypothetical protein [Crassvirales sp.]